MGTWSYTARSSAEGRAMKAERLTTRFTVRPRPVQLASHESPILISAFTRPSMYGMSWYIIPV